MDDGDGTQATIVAQVGVVERQLHRREHALVDHGATRQRRDVQPGACGLELGCDSLGLLAERIDVAVEVDAAEPWLSRFRFDSDEQLRHEGHAADCGLADVCAVDVDREVTPPEDGDALCLGERRDAVHRIAPGRLVHRQEAGAGSVSVRASLRRRREREIDCPTEQFVGQLDEDACAVAAIRLSACRTAVFEVLEREQTVGDNRMRPSTVDVGNHRDATRVYFCLWVVQALFGWERRKQHHEPPLDSRESNAEVLRDSAGPWSRCQDTTPLGTRVPG